MAKDPTGTQYIAERERERLVRLAAKAVRLKLHEDTEFGHSRNRTGIRSGAIAFSQRTDSRTVSVRDSNYGSLRESGAYMGANAPLVDACRRTLRAFGVPASEIAAVKVMREFGQVAERVAADNFRFEKPKLLRKFALASRAINGIPIWSSSATLGLTRSGAVGWFELHWPEIAQVVTQEALLLRDLVKRKWSPPEIEAARPESVEAGVIHSPAIGLFMDVLPVIRVIYSTKDRMFGRKPTYYLDRHGNSVPFPRSVEVQPLEPRERRSPRTEDHSAT